MKAPHIVREFPHKYREIENEFITMVDGTNLAARLWIPEGAEANPAPAILEYIPYRKRDLTRYRDNLNHRYLAGHGFAVARVDIRGSGDSEGVLTGEYLEQELADGLEILSWMAAQPWCSGRIGMIGISWGGFNALQLAALQPPELGAVVSWCSTDDRYADDVHYMGGCLLGDNLSWASIMFAYNSCPPDPAIVGDKWRDMWLERMEHSGLWLAQWLEHQHRDEFWKHGSICEDFSAIKCPVMTGSGWADGYSNAVFRLLEELDCPRRGIIGPWSHLYPHLGEPGPPIGFLQEVIRWFGHWLRDDDNGVEDAPMLQVWMQDSVPPSTQYQFRPGRWVAEPTWPSGDMEQHRMPLGPGQLAQPGTNTDRHAMSIQSPLSVGLFAGKWCSYAAAPDLPHDQREEDGGALIFESSPLIVPMEIMGAPALDLVFSSDKPVSMVALRLSDVAPNGKTTRTTYGVFNLTHRDGHEQPTPLIPNKIYRVRLAMNQVAQVFPRCHSLRLSVSTSYFPLAWPPPEQTMLTIYTCDSALLLPVRPIRSQENAIIKFDKPEGGPPLRKVVFNEGESNWSVYRDLAKDYSMLKVIKDEGRWNINETGTTVEKSMVEEYSYTGDDFESVCGKTQSIRAFSRKDWDVRTHTQTLLTCDKTSFHVHAELDAYENGLRIYCRNWDERILRVLV